MIVKLLEIRDDGTCIPMLCVDMNTAPEIGDSSKCDERRRRLLERCGYPCDGRPNVAITHLAANGDKCSNDPYFWGGRTRPVAHNYIIEHWADLKDGDVVDVEFILGERSAPKQSEIQESAR